MSVRDQIGG